MTAADQRPLPRGLALASLACAYAVATSGTILMPLIVAMLMRRFAIGEDLATGVAGIEILGVALACALLPHRIARAPRRFAAAGAVGAVLAQAAGAWLPSLAAVGLARGVAGLCEGALFVVVASSLSHGAAAERAWGGVILGAGILDGALLLGASSLPPAWADRWLFVVFAAAFALLAWPSARAGSVAAGVAPARPGERLRWRTLLPIWTLLILAYGVLAAQWAVADVVGQRLGLAPATSGLLLSLASVLGIAGCGVAAHPLSHAWRQPIVVVALAVMAASALGFFVARDELGFFAAQLVITLAFYALTPMLTARLSALDSDGALVARSVVVCFVSVALGTVLAGSLLARLGSLGLGLLLALCACAAIPFTRAALTDLAPPIFNPPATDLP